MTLKGTFINAHGHQIGLRIDSEHGGAQVLEIGTDDAGVWFAVDSIETESQASDTCTTILIAGGQTSRCSIILSTHGSSGRLPCVRE